jgi:hypothetical protein
MRLPSAATSIDSPASTLSYEARLHRVVAAQDERACEAPGSFHDHGVDVDRYYLIE